MSAIAVSTANHRYRNHGPAGFLALGCGAMGLAMALHYPVAQPWMAGIFAALIAFFCVWPTSWLVLMPALLPIIGFAPWTGWLTFEELDLLVLAAAAAGYARMAFGLPLARPNATQAERQASRSGSGGSALTLLLVALFAVSMLTSILRGFADAGGFAFGWFQGYHEPMNSVRLGKSFFEALLLAPLWLAANRQNPERARALLSWGLMLGLATASLATVWERVAFIGLLDFSSDYRTTGLFWEMHVGGAALDGFLALTVPFAVRELLATRSPLRWSLSAAVCALAGYACLTTFSRGVYLAVPVGLGILFVLQARQRKRAADANPTAQAAMHNGSGWPAGVLLVAGFGVGAGWMFQTSGYRGAAALLGAMALLVPLAGALRPMPLGHWIAGGVGGLLLAGIAASMAWLVPKGAYIAYAMAFVFTALLRYALHQRAVSIRSGGPMALAGFMATVAAVMLVARHWGYAPAITPAAAAALACLLLLVAAGTVSRPLWPDAMRWQAGLVSVMGLALAVIGIFGGGVYMEDRFSTGGRDLENRLAHWKLGADMLQTRADWWLGKGQGRFPANYFLVGNPTDRPGDYRLQREGDHAYLALAGGLNLGGDGELLRVTQRVPVPERPAWVGAQVRTAMGVTLRFEVCEKHLLYNQSCLQTDIAVKAAPGKWQTVHAELQGNGLSRGRWYAPRLIAFSVATETLAGTAELGQLQLAGPDGRNLLANDDFSDGMGHWFFSSDKNHLPWHIKNVLMHVLFEQGLIGLTLWTLLVGGTLLRLGAGRARDHPLAPVLAASLAAFVTVGLFDSLLDVPRVATLFYFLVIAGLTLKVKSEPKPRSQSTAAGGPGGGANNIAVATHRYRPTRRANIAWRAFALVGLIAVAAVGLLVNFADRSLVELARKTPAEGIRYAKPWLREHRWLAAALLPPLDWLQASMERPPPLEPLPTLGKGQQTQALPTQHFGPNGEPLAVDGPAPAGADIMANLEADSALELATAMERAIAGQVVQIRPGRYRMSSAMVTYHAGAPDKPITLRAAKPGTVLIEFDTVEGFRVVQPYWVFENLTIRGVCRQDTDCEHAFHIVGAARGTVLRNNRVENFNAHVKVNGADGQWPDNGLAQFNTLTNDHPRNTARPVTPFDLVSASGWQVSDNLITDFVKAGGNKISYGIFMKGAGSRGRIERNLIICTSSQISQDGSRVGLSWGAGGVEAGFCRDKKCAFDFTEGLAANNIVAHCNDAGIDTNRSRQIILANNTLINTAGILVRGESQDVNIYGNLLEGRIRSHDSVTVIQAKNDLVPLQKVLLDPDRFRLNHNRSTPSDIRSIPQVPKDFCNHPRSAVTRTGATGSEPPPCGAPTR